MKALRFAFLLAASCTMLAVVPNASPFAAVSAAEETETAVELPDWVPTDYESASAFLRELEAPGTVASLNQGARIADGLVCLVFRERAQGTLPEPRYQFSVTPELFETVSDAVTDSKYGDVYHIYVFKPLKAGTADVYNIPQNAQKTPVPFRFQIDDDLHVTEIKLPQWLPVDFDSASAFLNQRGSTRISDGYLCMVFAEYVPVVSSLPLDHYYKVYKTGESLECIFSQHFTNGDGYFFRVDLYKPVCAGEAEITHDECESSVAANPYTFRVGEDLRITETDPCGWAPDCYTEFYTRYNDGERILVHGDQIAFLLTATAGTGYSWNAQPTTGAVQNGFNGCNQFRAEKAGEQRSGGEIAWVEVYRARQDGPFDLRLDLMPPGQDAEPAETLGGTFYAADDCSMILKPGESRVSVIDADTGKPVAYPYSEKKSFYLDYLVGEYENGPENFNFPQFCEIKSNPGKAALGDIFSEEQYKLWMGSLPLGYNCTAVYENGKCDTDDVITVNMLTDTIADITVKVKFAPEGDLNDDGSFSIADAVLLQRWLLCDPDASIKNWKAADFCNDDCLNACDLTAMKQALLARMKAEAESGKVLIVKTSYGGYSVAGEPLGSGSFETVFHVCEGDRFYEDSQGHWYQNVRRIGSKTPILTIGKIEDSTVTVSVQWEDSTTEATLELGELAEYFPRSQYVVYDGINYSYDIRFESSAALTPVQQEEPAV
jgi:hypothetical protein